MSEGTAHWRVARWAMVSIVLGVACGLAAVALGWLTVGAEVLHQQQPWTLVFLPFVAVFSVWLYRRFRIPFDTGAPAVIHAQRVDKPVTWKLFPALLTCVPLALISGASVGRDAAGMQAGGGIASSLAPLVHKEAGAQRVLILAGMASMVSALLFVPLGGILFAFEIVRMKRSEYRDARLLCVPISALIASAITNFFGAGRVAPVQLSLPALSNALMCCATTAVVCAVVGFIFVTLLKGIGTVCDRFLSNTYVRMVVGSLGACVFVLTCGTDAVSGSGLDGIALATAGEEIPLSLFMLKLVFTVWCLGVGFKGGAITPLLCVGALAGCSLAQVVGFPLSFTAALGAVAALAAGARSPAGAAVMGMELFGFAGAPYFLVAALVASCVGLLDNLYAKPYWRFGNRSVIHHRVDDDNK
ncbi:chloride channel protein [Cryptobacterium curtum]